MLAGAPDGARAAQVPRPEMPQQALGAPSASTSASFFATHWCGKECLGCSSSFCWMFRKEKKKKKFKKDGGDVWRGGNVGFRNDVYFGSSSTVIMPFTQLAGASAAAKVRGGGNGQAALGRRPWACVCVCL